MRLLKHNWWDFLYEKIRVWSNVFFDFIFNENSFGTTMSIVCRLNFSPCMRMISNYDFYFIVVDRFFSFWTTEDRSYRNHQMKLIIIGLSRSKKNQNTIEKNEFYEWEIWRTIMKTMSENSFICIKINSWLPPDLIWSNEAPSALLSINRLPPYHHHFNSWPPPNLIWSNGALPAPIPINQTPSYHHHFNSWPPPDLIWSNGAPPAPLPTTGPIQTNISIAGPPGIKRGPRQHPSLPSAHTGQIWTFFSWNNPPKTTLYGGFWWFSYRRIFPFIFLHGLNFEFHFISFYQWDE